MSQRDSGYERKEWDAYETPAWVTKVLLPHLPTERIRNVWEPACGGGKMVNVLKEKIDDIRATDIAGDPSVDFLCQEGSHWDAIITNPPYELADKFISRAMALAPFVAMLLRTDFDHAQTRRHLFAACTSFAKKVVLTKRIRWFEDSNGSPSFNHAWFIWDSHHKGPPVLAYGP